MINWLKRFEIHGDRLPDILMEDVASENILSARVLELCLTLAVWSIWDRNKREDKQLRNSFTDVFLS